MPDHPLIEVHQIERLPELFGEFQGEAAAEGFDTITVLRDEWIVGSQRFERQGEALFLATVDGIEAGIGGITQDFVEASCLRMRRFYVRPGYRRLGIGRKIALRILDQARPLNRQIVLHADGRSAEAFWLTLGFVPVDRPHTTHILGRST